MSDYNGQVSVLGDIGLYIQYEAFHELVGKAKVMKTDEGTSLCAHVKGC